MRGGGGDAREKRGRAYLRLRSVEEILESENQERSSQANNHDQAEVLSLKTERYQNGKTQ